MTLSAYERQEKDEAKQRKRLAKKVLLAVSTGVDRYIAETGMRESDLEIVTAETMLRGVASIRGIPVRHEATAPPGFYVREKNEQEAIP